MPELPVKEVRPSELRLPEIKREDIVRTLSGIKFPEVDLTGIDRSNLEEATRSIGRMASVAAGALHLVPRARPPRWPLALGGLVVAGIAVAVLANESVRTRLTEGATAVRERVTAMRMSADEMLDVGPDDAATFDTGETATSPRGSALG